MSLYPARALVSWSPSSSLNHTIDSDNLFFYYIINITFVGAGSFVSINLTIQTPFESQFYDDPFMKNQSSCLIFHHSDKDDDDDPGTDFWGLDMQSQHVFYFLYIAKSWMFINVIIILIYIIL